jgi:hypothetical protein
MQEDLVELLMHIFGGISIFCSCIVILIYLLNSSLRLNLTNEIIFYIAISDLFSAAGGILGFVHEDTILCQYQAILTNIFPITGIYWTTLLVYYMIGLVANKKVFLQISWEFHFIGWIFPIILTLLPLTTNRYGVPGNDDEVGWCFIDHRPSSPSWSTLFWMIFSFYIWIWLSEIFFAGFAVYLIYILYIKKLILPSSRQYLLNALVLYPISSFFCWIFPCYDDIFHTSTHHFIDRHHPHHHGTSIVTSLAYLLPLFQGFLTCLIFLVMNHEVLYIVIQFLDRILFTLSCGKSSNYLTSLLMRFHHASPTGGPNGHNRHQDGNHLIGGDRYCSESQRDQISRFDLTSKETITSEYEIQGTLKENFDECSVVIC